jgi:hypothetical protein
MPAMLRRALVIAVIAIAGTVPVSAAAATSPLCSRGLTLELDPRGLLPLEGANGIGLAKSAALRLDRRSSRPLVRRAVRATADRWRGPQAKFECGTRVWRRTIVVYITDRAFLPAQSASERVFFVGRVRSGYRVWQVVH